MKPGETIYEVCISGFENQDSATEFMCFIANEYGIALNNIEFKARTPVIWEDCDVQSKE